jgi:hypothetical protein
MLAAATLAHLDKHQRAIGIAHDQIYFSASPAGGPIIALLQFQALGLQMAQCAVFGRISFLLGG